MPLRPERFGFTAIFLGCWILTSSYAVLRSAGQTVLLASLLLLVVLTATGNRERPPASWSNAARGFAGWLFFLASWMSLSFFIFGGSPPSWGAHQDASFYAAAASAMVVTGVETSAGVGAELMASYREPLPYHYLDLWMTGLLSEEFGRSPLSCLVFLTCPFLLSLLSYGVFTIGREVFPEASPARSLLAAFVAPLTAGFALTQSLAASIPGFVWALPWLVYPRTALMTPKIAVPAAALILSWHLFSQRSWRGALLAPLLAVSHSVIVWPAFLGGVLVSTWFLKRRGRITKRAVFGVAALVLGMMSALLFFYLGDGESGRKLPWEGLVMARNFLKGWTYILPSAALLFLASRVSQHTWQEFPEAWREMVGGIALGGVLGITLGGGNENGYQLLSIPWMAVLSIVFSLLFAELAGALERSQRGLLRLGLLLFLLQAKLALVMPLYQGDSSNWMRGEFRSGCSELWGDSQEVRVAVLEAPESLRLKGWVRPYLSPAGKDLMWLDRPRVLVVNISDLYCSEFQLKLKGRALLSDFCAERGLDLGPEATLKFLKEKGIPYVLLEDGRRLPSWILPLVQKRIEAPKNRVLLELSIP